MGFNPENYKRIRKEYESKYRVAEEAAEERRRALHGEHPEIAEIDALLAETGIKVFRAAVEGKGVEDVRAENRVLREKRAKLLALAGYPEDYTEPKYECAACRDSGYVGFQMCECMRRRLMEAGYESSGIARLMRVQTFDSFRLDYYQGEDRERMQRTLVYFMDYAKQFRLGDDPSPSLTLVGGTGLGKTHLSTAVAKEVIDRGFDVVYISALDLFDELDEQKFRKKGRTDVPDTDRFFSADLLILDDLGTEMTNQFTISELYHLLNVRINRALPTIVSTNLGGNDLQERYSDRIASRLFGEFRPILFTGTDVRKLKRMQNPW